MSAGIRNRVEEGESEGRAQGCREEQPQALQVDAREPDNKQQAREGQRLTVEVPRSVPPSPGPLDLCLRQLGLAVVSFASPTIRCFALHVHRLSGELGKLMKS